MDLPPQRKTIQYSISAVCMSAPRWSSVPQTTRNTIVRRVERSCFVETIAQCTVDGIGRQFDNPQFVNRYSAICSKLLGSIDMFGECHSTLIDDLIDGNVDPSAVATLSSQELCPDAAAAERNEIERRKAAKVDTKYATTYTCRKCGCSKTTKLDAQTRGGDEQSTNSIRCAVCSFTWRK